MGCCSMGQEVMGPASAILIGLLVDAYLGGIEIKAALGGCGVSLIGAWTAGDE